MRNLPHHIWHLPRNAIVLALRGYQHTLSPDHGPLRHLHPHGYCRHSPTCSQYAIETVAQRGVLIGMPLSVWRVLRCNPWTKPNERRMRETIDRMNGS